MKNFNTVLVAILLLCPAWVLAQMNPSALTLAPGRDCGTSSYMQKQLAANPEFAQRLAEIEAQTASFISAGGNKMQVVYTIPVVVHVVYNTAGQNISDAQIQSQLVVLNNDFRRLNADRTSTPAAFTGVAADAEINFCLATVDPTGAATTGITRTSTATTSFTDNDAVKSNSTGGKTPWDATKYLNIWVCNLSGTLLGYAQFPGGPTSTDGVVIDYQYFGTTGTATAPFNLGRTATHEVGHYFNLYHIWGDAFCASDLVADTPTQQQDNAGCPAFPHVTCSNGPNGDMFMNYMDYTDDGCMNLFTSGQKSRMQATLAAGGPRVSLTTSNGCGGTPTYCAANGNSVAYEWISNVTFGTINNNSTGTTGGYANYTSTSATVTKGSAYSVSLKTGYASTAYTEYWNVYIDYNNDLDFADAGELAFSGTTNSTTPLTGSVTIPTTAATATVRMRVRMSDAITTNPCGTFSYGEVEDYTLIIQTSATCTDSYETNETSGAAKTVAVNTNILAKICTSTDIDWYKFTTTSTAPKVKVTLTTLPADYDVVLYNSSVTQIGSSANGGTTSETIIFNTATTAATFYVKVFGFNGAFNSTSSYTLRASTQAANWRMSPEEEAARDFSKPGSGEPVIEEATESLLFPNPTQDESTLSLFAAEGEQVTVTLTDLTGKVVETISFTAGSGRNEVTLNTRTLSSGLYLVNLHRNGSAETLRLSVNR